MATYLSTRSQNTTFLPILLKKNKVKDFLFLRKNHGLTSLEKCKIFEFLNRCIYSVKWLVFCLEGHKTLSFGLFC